MQQPRMDFGSVGHLLETLWKFRLSKVIEKNGYNSEEDLEGILEFWHELFNSFLEY